MSNKEQIEAQYRLYLIRAFIFIPFLILIALLPLWFILQAIQLNNAPILLTLFLLAFLAGIAWLLSVEIKIISQATALIKNVRTGNIPTDAMFNTATFSLDNKKITVQAWMDTRYYSKNGGFYALIFKDKTLFKKCKLGNFYYHSSLTLEKETQTIKLDDNQTLSLRAHYTNNKQSGTNWAFYDAIRIEIKLNNKPIDTIKIWGVQNLRDPQWR